MTGVLLAGLAVSIGTGPGWSAEQPVAVKPLAEGLWTDLDSPDAGRVARTLLILAATPHETIVFLEKHLQPERYSARRINQFIADLDSAEFTVRQQATADLEDLGKLVESALLQVLQTRPSLEVRLRIDRLLEHNTTLSPDCLRVLRAVALLEHISSDGARGVLEKLVQGEPRALPVQAARAALERAAGKTVGTPESRWADLASPDSVKVAHATLAFASAPREALAVYRKTLPSVPAVDPQVVAGLIDDLDSERYAPRARAAKELVQMGEFVVPYLQQVLAGNPPLEVRQRVTQIVDKIKPRPKAEPLDTTQAEQKQLAEQQQMIRERLEQLVEEIEEKEGRLKPIVRRRPSLLPADSELRQLWSRALCAIAVLEHIGSTEAREVLRTLASGPANALPTKEAEAALERLRNND